MGKMNQANDRRDEVLGARLREAMDDLSARGEPDFAAIELAAGSQGAMPASARPVPPAPPARRRPPRAFLLLSAAAAVALAIGLGIGWNRLAESRRAAMDGDGAADILSSALPEDSQGYPLGTEVSLLARESVGGDGSLSYPAPGLQGSFTDEVSAFVADLWEGWDASTASSWGEPAEGGY